MRFPWFSPLPWLFLGVFLLTACSSSSPPAAKSDGGSGPIADAGPGTLPDAFVPPTDGGTDETGEAGGSATCALESADCTNTPCCSGVCTAGKCNCIYGGAFSGGTCSQNQDCCSGVCASGACTECNAAGAICHENANCCDGICNNGICGCAAIGAGCGSPTDCCNGTCATVDGGAAFCQCMGEESADTCKTDADCCSGLSCQQGRCLGTIGAPCATYFDCVTNNCTSGKCACILSGDSSSAASLCCSGIGQIPSDGGAGTCIGTPGMPCTSGSDCTTQQCGGATDDDQCACSLLNGPCLSNSDCCSTATTCDATLQQCCIPSKQSCAEDSDCCSGVCSLEFTCQ